MKAMIYSCLIYEGTLAMAHGMGERINRMLIEDGKECVIITPYHGRVYVTTDRSQVEKCGEIGAIEVPDELLPLAWSVMQSEAELINFVTSDDDLAGHFAKQHPTP